MIESVPMTDSIDDGRRYRASHSFTPQEVDLLHQIFRTLMRGGDVAVLRRNPSFARLYEKALHMKKRCEEQRRADEESGRFPTGD